MAREVDIFLARDTEDGLGGSLGLAVGVLAHIVHQPQRVSLAWFRHGAGARCFEKRKRKRVLH